jgi:hypothetical protein
VPDFNLVEASEPDFNLVEASEPDCNLAERRTQNSSAGAIASLKPSHAAKASRNASRKGRNAAECMYLWGRGAVVSTCMHGRSSVAINGRGHAHMNVVPESMMVEVGREPIGRSP